MAYFGKEFVLASQENFDKFVESWGSAVPEAYKQATLNHKATLKVLKNANGTYTMITSSPNEPHKETTFTSGVEFDHELGGNKVKTTVTVEGNKATSVSKFESGDVLTVVREFSDNQVVATITSSKFDGVAKRVYKAA